MFTSTLIADWTHSVFEATWLASNTSLSCTSELSLCPKFSRLTLISRKPRESPLSKLELRSKLGEKTDTSLFFAVQVSKLCVCPFSPAPRRAVLTPTNASLSSKSPKVQRSFCPLQGFHSDILSTIFAKAFPDRVLLREPGLVGCSLLIGQEIEWEDIIVSDLIFWPWLRDAWHLTVSLHTLVGRT